MLFKTESDHSKFLRTAAPDHQFPWYYKYGILTVSTSTEQSPS